MCACKCHCTEPAAKTVSNSKGNKTPHKCLKIQSQSTSCWDYSLDSFAAGIFRDFLLIYIVFHSIQKCRNVLISFQEFSVYRSKIPEFYDNCWFAILLCGLFNIDRHLHETARSVTTQVRSLWPTIYLFHKFYYNILFLSVEKLITQHAESISWLDLCNRCTVC